ncbi:glycosyltransferase [Streptomyces sp. NBC_00257]|uniref:glycosyltransferase n=1 Tax=Streptomyces TaxID=1883 RepID=UPI002255A76D|nr:MULTISPECIES: glycosyltransferase [unclassified Streptomyces]WTB52490.1 glycosyltransferase [Streptomyces sp. NBC_00826]WTH94618.1 glycosyltransferase [Streptomyces sp. NBC_00825]WTI03353.1 glycosyltransferase [Streptomyces sp. NBC_00822]MCX4868903.1 glycosyltransferase [Streptomyces sp. NBC_00906]MCX4900141.1 glycosyltransferase [Streptomyces sp. NBC_00892]
MSAVAWIAVGSLAAWVWLLLGQGFFWRTDQRLPRREAPARWPSVAIVVPARDEADMLPVSLPSLLAQDYPGRAEVFLVDDCSKDGTGDVARALSVRFGGLPVTVVSPGEPGPGWTGKLWAVRHGISLARTREPDYLLLTDADIAHEPDSLRELVAAAESGGFDLVSQMARLRVSSLWERLVVPAFVYFFSQLYPFRWVNRAGARTAAAAGGCVLLRTGAAERARVPESIRQAVIDDVSLARAVQRSGGRIWLGLAERVDSVRPYPRLADLWRMVSRSAYAQLRHSPALLLGTVLGLALVYLVPPVALVTGLLAGDPVAARAGGLAWVVMSGTYLPMLGYYRQSLWSAPLLPFTAALYLLMTVDSAVQHYRGRGAAWKGRTYARPEAAPDR